MSFLWYVVIYLGIGIVIAAAFMGYDQSDSEVERDKLFLGTVLFWILLPPFLIGFLLRRQADKKAQKDGE